MFPALRAARYQNLRNSRGNFRPRRLLDLQSIIALDLTYLRERMQSIVGPMPPLLWPASQDPNASWHPLEVELSIWF